MEYFRYFIQHKASLGPEKVFKMPLTLFLVLLSEKAKISLHHSTLKELELQNVERKVL